MKGLARGESISQRANEAPDTKEFKDVKENIAGKPTRQCPMPQWINDRQ